MSDKQIDCAFDMNNGRANKDDKRDINLVLVVTGCLSYSKYFIVGEKILLSSNLNA